MSEQTLAAPIDDAQEQERGFSRYQSVLVALLAFVQFTIILDFIIMSPLGAILMPALNITAGQFGVAVSAYAFSAGISGVLAAGFADKFDRKRLLLFFYVGFTAGTTLCALAPTYHVLLLGRIVTGLFGGVVGSVVLAIVTDLFPLHERGRVMGFVQTAFAASQVLGIPVGLFLANRWNWHVSFGAIVVLAITVIFSVVLLMRPVNEHLKLKQHRNAFAHLIATVTEPSYTLAFGVTTLLATGGFMLMPFGSAFTVHNLGIGIEHLPTIYLVSGLFSIFTGPLVGRLSDAIGKFPTFVFGTAMSIVMVLIYTHLGRNHAVRRDRGQCADVRRHFLAHDPISGADVGDPCGPSARLVQLHQRFGSAAIRRPRIGARRSDHHGKRGRLAQPFRPHRLCRGRHVAGGTDRDVFRAETDCAEGRQGHRLRRLRRPIS